MPRPTPNIIYIVCHDLGRELGCYGRGIDTPNLDAFAKNAVRFDQACCNSTACSPSRACVMTGLYPHQSGVMGLSHFGWSMPHETPSIVDYFNTDGRYETIHIGLQHERGLDGGTNHYALDLWSRHQDTFTEIAVDKAQAFFAARAGAVRPMYVNIGLLETHPERWGPPYQHDRARLYKPFEPEELAWPRYVSGQENGDMLRRFQGSIRYMDFHLGRLLDTLEQLGYFDNSIIVFTTDHGPALGPRTKGTLYEPGIGITLLMRPPGGMGGKGKGDKHLIQNMDMTPTFLEAAEVEIPERIEGRSFWPLLAGGTYQPHEAIFCQRNYHGSPISGNYYDPIRACRTERLLYIENHQPHQDRDERELFDLAVDPHSLTNVIDQPAHQQDAVDLSKQIQSWMQRTGDPLLHGPIPDPLAK